MCIVMQFYLFDYVYVLNILLSAIYLSIYLSFLVLWFPMERLHYSFAYLPLFRASPWLQYKIIYSSAFHYCVLICALVAQQNRSTASSVFAFRFILLFQYLLIALEQLNNLYGVRSSFFTEYLILSFYLFSFHFHFFLSCCSMSQSNVNLYRFIRNRNGSSKEVKRTLTNTNVFKVSRNGIHFMCRCLCLCQTWIVTDPTDWTV